MKQNKNIEVKFRCTPEDKRMLGGLAEATKESESEVLRQLIHLGWRKFYLDLTAKRFDGARYEPFILSLDGSNAVTENMISTLGVVTTILMERGRQDLANEIYGTLFAPETRDDSVARLKDIFIRYLEISMQDGADDAQ